MEYEKLVSKSESDLKDYNLYQTNFRNERYEKRNLKKIKVGELLEPKALSEAKSATKNIFGDRR